MGWVASLGAGLMVNNGSGLSTVSSGPRKLAYCIVGSAENYTMFLLWAPQQQDLFLLFWGKGRGLGVKGPVMYQK